MKWNIEWVSFTNKILSEVPAAVVSVHAIVRLYYQPTLCVVCRVECSVWMNAVEWKPNFNFILWENWVCIIRVYISIFSQCIVHKRAYELDLKLPWYWVRRSERTKCAHFMWSWMSVSQLFQIIAIYYLIFSYGSASLSRAAAHVL